MNFFVSFVPLPGSLLGPLPGVSLAQFLPLCAPFTVSHSHLLPDPLSSPHLPFPPRSALCLHSGFPRSAVTSYWAPGCCGWVACGYGPPPTQAWPLVSGCQGSASFVVIISSSAQRPALVPLLPRTWCIYGVYRRSAWSLQLTLQTKRSIWSS